ncbi:MAG: hypothetical protein M1821_001540 [Bathelium mastoideum]|nr:MAG: hypothetical protein M1821_001540 [Bathelium mastoideum]
MAASPIPLFQEPRVKADNYANLNGHTYHYILGQPHNGSYRATVFLIHGWPDLSAGWRYQIPMLIGCNLRVVALDMMGYGETDAPRVPPHSIHLYGFKRAADDIEELARQLGSSKIILGGHDWGGAVVYRVAQYKPWLVTALFSVCTPYVQLTSTYRSTKDIVQLSAPQFAYQLHLASGEIEDTLKTRVQIRQFLNSIYGGKSPTGEVAFNPYKGFDFEVSAKAEKTRLVDDNVSECRHISTRPYILNCETYAA